MCVGTLRARRAPPVVATSWATRARAAVPALVLVFALFIAVSARAGVMTPVLAVAVFVTALLAVAVMIACFLLLPGLLALFTLATTTLILRVRIRV